MRFEMDFFSFEVQIVSCIDLLHFIFEAQSVIKKNKQCDAL